MTPASEPFPDDIVDESNIRTVDRGVDRTEEDLLFALLPIRRHLVQATSSGTDSPETLTLLARLLTAVENAVSLVESADCFRVGPQEIVRAVESQHLLTELYAALRPVR